MVENHGLNMSQLHVTTTLYGFPQDLINATLLLCYEVLLGAKDSLTLRVILPNLVAQLLDASFRPSKKCTNVEGLLHLASRF